MLIRTVLFFAPHNILRCVQEFNAIVLDTKSTILEYHKREGDPQASVTPWQDDERVITFAVPLTGVPEVIKTAIGDEKCPAIVVHSFCPAGLSA
jgi:hypothetical protein